MTGQDEAEGVMTDQVEVIAENPAHDRDDQRPTPIGILIGYLPFLVAILVGPSAFTLIFVLLGWVSMFSIRRREGVVIAALATLITLLVIGLLLLPRSITVS
jgi:hypothetical protein